ncbi:hypothetical protein Q5692_38760 [Microcoleus sp. C2C3]|uniref:hypothetical protein n=1 Tax=unclassified Microcoleus TaxID=2642155 RepID=UPI002FD0CF07
MATSELDQLNKTSQLSEEEILELKVKHINEWVEGSGVDFKLAWLAVKTLTDHAFIPHSADI